MRRAHSLVEILIASVVLVLALLPLLGLFTASGRQGRQTGDQGLTLALLEKTAEELRVATWENPYAALTLRQNADLAVTRSVVGGASPFYPVIEDLREPLGAMDGADPGITPEFATLHRALSTHRLGFSAAAADLTSGAATDLRLEMRWTGFKQDEEQQDLMVRLPERHGIAPDVPLPERDAADRLVAQVLFPGRAEPLAALVAATGGDLATVRALGDVALLSMGFSELESTYRANLAALETAASDPVTAVAAALAVARTHERRAAQALSVLACQLEPLRVLAAPGAFARLGTPAPDPRYTRLPLIALGALPGAFASALAAARDGYAAACAAPLAAGLRPRVRLRVLLKLVELLKVRALTSAPEDFPALKELLDRIKTEQTGRNPNFVDYATAESERCFDLPTLTASYPRAEPARWREASPLAETVAEALSPPLPGP